jgi:hypothetical protein
MVNQLDDVQNVNPEQACLTAGHIQFAQHSQATYSSPSTPARQRVDRAKARPEAPSSVKATRVSTVKGAKPDRYNC